jgi:hypothetical protein
MGNIVKNTENKGLTAQNLDELFDGPLKPMNSGNARLVYKIFYDAKDQGLTTIDIQHLLEDYDREYNKKDLHNWLNDLMASDLITKESQRGKPTIVPYNGRYTYDIWRLTPQGYQIGRKIEGFLGKHPNLIEEKIIEKTRLSVLNELKSSDLNKIQTLYMNSAILMALHESGGSMDLKSLSEKTMVKPEPLGRFLQTQQKNGSPPLYQLSEKTMGIGEWILQTLGLSSFKNLLVSLSPEGKKIVEGFLSA